MTTDISVGVRWDPIGNQDVIEDYEFEYDGGNSSSRLFERSRIKALAGKEIMRLRFCATIPFDEKFKFIIHSVKNLFNFTLTF